MNTNPVVSIVMNCHNGASYLKEAIDSVYAQTYSDWEIILWDNASTDESPKISQNYDSRLRYFRNDVMTSLGKARNLAMEEAKGQYIAFLDVDDLWLPQKLEKQIPLFKNNRTGLVFCDTYFFNEKEIIKQYYKAKKPPRGMVFKELLVDYFLSMETVVIRKEALLSLDEWFDERFNLAEEADLFIRIAHDWQIDYIDEPLAKWRVHGSSWTWTKTELFTIEKEMMLDKYSQIYQNFNEEFKKESVAMKAGIEYGYSMLEWEKGKPRNLRKRLRPYLFFKKKFLIIYLFSFFPYSRYRKILLFFRPWIPKS